VIVICAYYLHLEEVAMASETFPTIFGRLVALHEDVQQPEYLLEAGKYAIGRLPEICQIVVNRKAVSRIHAEIERRGSHFVLHNLGRNGTFVDGKRVEGEHILKNEERIGFSTPEPLFVFADSDPTVIPIEVLRYEEKLLTFFLKDQPLDLTPSQFRLLQYLYRHAGQVCTRESCAKAIWQDEYLPEMETDNLDKVIHSLRARLRSADPEADLIRIRRGVGYMLEF